MLMIGAMAALPMVALSFLTVEKNTTSILIAVGLYLVSAIWTSVATMAIYASAAQPDIRSFNDVIRLGAHRWVDFATTQLLQGAVIMLPLLLLFGGFVVVSYSTIQNLSDNTLSNAQVGSMLLAVSLFLIGCIIISFWAFRFSFAGFIVFREKIKNIAALKASYSITRGHYVELWRKFFLFGLCLVGISIAVSILSDITTTSLAKESLAHDIVESAFSLLQYVITIPLQTIFLAVLYDALRQPKNELALNS